MAWKIAKEAMAKAVEVYEKLAALSATVDHIRAQIIDFRDETRKRLTDYEARLDNKQCTSENRMDARFSDLEKRTDDKVARMEARLLEIERRCGIVEAKVEGALATAYGTILNNAQNQGRLPKLPEHVQDIHPKPTLKGGNGDDVID